MENEAIEIVQQNIGSVSPVPTPAPFEGESSSKLRGGYFYPSIGKMVGQRIKPLRVNPSLVQRVISSVKLPPRPVYETKTFSGRVETHPMDEVSAAQTPGGDGIWQQYLEDKKEANLKRNERLAAVLFSRGTEYTLPNNQWESEHEALGIEVPTEPGLKRAHFLATELEPEDINDLITEILRLTGVTEDKIKEAEATF